MNQPQQTGKRIVSKGEYAWIISRKAILGLGSASLTFVIAIGFLAAVILALMGIVDGILGIADLSHPSVLGYSVLCLVGAIFCGYATHKIKHIAETGMEKAIQKEHLLLLTRANTADLPTPDSLVRASQEPLQAQETVLLRAATETTDVQEAQLLRASGEPE